VGFSAKREGIMKIKRFLLYAGIIIGLNVGLLYLFGMYDQGQEMSAQDKMMMEQMMKYGTPAKEHELLKKYVGEWDVDVSTWKDPMSPPEKSKAMMKNTLLFDGRYVKCSFEGMMSGMKFQGLEVIGYDLFKKMYTTFWIDSWSTAFMVTTGTLDPMGKVLTETGMFPDPMTDGKTMQKVRNVTTFMGDGSFKFEMYMIMPDGKESKGMEMVCKRK
jgi:hypothetical protein